MGPPPSHTKHRLLSLAPPHLACQVRVLGESYTPEDEEDSCVAEVSAVWVYQARYRVPVSKAVAGNLVLLEGVDNTITKTATLIAEAYEGTVHIFRYAWCVWVGGHTSGV